MSLKARPFYNTFALALPYLTVSWEYGRLYAIEVNWPIGLWGIEWQIRFPAKRRVRASHAARDVWADGMEFDDAVDMGIGVAFGLAGLSEPGANLPSDLLAPERRGDVADVSVGSVPLRADEKMAPGVVPSAPSPMIRKKANPEERAKRQQAALNEAVLCPICATVAMFKCPKCAEEFYDHTQSLADSAQHNGLIRGVDQGGVAPPPEEPTP